MKERFHTFQPKNPVVAKYVDYYYLDIKPENTIHTYQCFPHFNNTISLYKSHIETGNGKVTFDENAGVLQIFTPIRQKVLHVLQSGQVHRVVIVFHPLGIQQFYNHVKFTDLTTDSEFFSSEELNLIFSTPDPELLTKLLDAFLQERFCPFQNPILERSVQYVFDHCEHFTVTSLSANLGISRQHLNRSFQTHLGVSVKKFHEIVLFRKTVHQKLFERPDKSFTELAYEFNYNDQSHLNKAYKNLTENSPGSFFDQGTVLGTQDTFWHLLS
ncbi:AraC family transcriptional regulator [Chryseobacterium pennipullorum]|uniref:AraC family transcriptional regulator n=1 Tax=Chryseobacterium pennipullorum TaxID=2258963 RepID=A0A3D9AYV8_9FLAO|nr:helix-turn-helix domain-containing protein [Chryseobacterium pennipullorum]REC46524.1 AraC family transcriptional regulator [Chryseobacterium pennipullorum]